MFTTCIVAKHMSMSQLTVCQIPISKMEAYSYGLTYDWFQMLDSGKEVCGIFFDIQKTYDSIPHHALMQKLQYAGLNSILHGFVVT